MKNKFLFEMKSRGYLHQCTDFDNLERISSQKSITAYIGFDCTASSCLLYTSDAADDLLCVDLGGRRIIKKKRFKYLCKRNFRTREKNYFISLKSYKLFQ